MRGISTHRTISTFFIDADLNHEILPSNNLTSADVLIHPAVDIIEDLYAINQGATLWHYRDPDQINVRWQNLMERPTEATAAEMITGEEGESRIVSPLGVAQAIAARTMHDDTLVGSGTAADLLGVIPRQPMPVFVKASGASHRRWTRVMRKVPPGDYALTILELNGYGRPCTVSRSSTPVIPLRNKPPYRFLAWSGSAALITAIGN